MAHGPLIHRLQDGPAFLFNQFHTLPFAARPHFFCFFPSRDQQKDKLVVDVGFAVWLLLYSSGRQRWERLLRICLFPCLTLLSLPDKGLFFG